MAHVYDRCLGQSCVGLGLLLVLAEEAIVTRLIKRGRLRRWRITTVVAESSPT